MCHRIGSRTLGAQTDDHQGGSMNTQTNPSPADDRFATQQADDRGDIVIWGERVSDDTYAQAPPLKAGDR